MKFPRSYIGDVDNRLEKNDNSGMLSSGPTTYLFVQKCSLNASDKNPKPNSAPLKSVVKTG